MKTFVILTFLLLYMRIGFAQDSLMIAKEDWNYIKTTTLELDSALTECNELNKLYEGRMSEFQLQVYSLLLSAFLLDNYSLYLLGNVLDGI